MTQVAIHNGVNIVLGGNGKFIASINGATVTADSLASMKRKIEKSGVFESFEAYVRSGYATVLKAKIVGKKTVRGQKVFVSTRGEIPVGSVWRVTDESERYFAEETEMELRHTKERNDLRERHAKERGELLRKNPGAEVW